MKIREGWEGLVVSLTMALVAAVLIFGSKLVSLWLR